MPGFIGLGIHKKPRFRVPWIQIKHKAGVRVLGICPKMQDAESQGFTQKAGFKVSGIHKIPQDSETWDSQKSQESES